MSVVAVTGASGFIGRYLCPALETAGHDVLRLGRGTGADRVTDYSRSSLEGALKGADAVIHLAGRRMTRDDDLMDIAPFWAPNVATMADLVATARVHGLGRVVLASTIGVYGPESGYPFRETARTCPTNAYAFSKVAAEKHLEMLTRRDGPSAVSARLAAVYGHGEKGTPALMTFANRAEAGKPLVLRGNPNHLIDQIYVRDAVAGLIACLGSDTTGPVNIGGGRAIPVREIAETAARTWNRPPPVEDGATPGPAPDTKLDLTRAAEALGWQPRYDLAAGLADMRATRDTSSGG